MFEAAKVSMILGSGDFSIARKPRRDGTGGLDNDVWLTFKHGDKHQEKMTISINLSLLVRQSHSHKVQGLSPEEELQVLTAAAPNQVRVYRNKAVFCLCERAAAEWFEAIGSCGNVAQPQAQSA